MFPLKKNLVWIVTKDEDLVLPSFEHFRPRQLDEAVAESRRFENIQVPGAENIRLPVAESTHIPVAVNTYLPLAENTHLPGAENIHLPGAENTHLSGAENGHVTVAEASKALAYTSSDLQTTGTASTEDEETGMETTTNINLNQTEAETEKLQKIISVMEDIRFVIYQEWRPGGCLSNLV